MVAMTLLHRFHSPQRRQTHRRLVILESCGNLVAAPACPKGFEHLDGELSNFLLGILEGLGDLLRIRPRVARMSHEILKRTLPRPHTWVTKLTGGTTAFLGRSSVGQQMGHLGSKAMGGNRNLSAAPLVLPCQMYILQHRVLYTPRDRSEGQNT